jgi:DNA-binding response OmpR family regulator
MRTALVLLDLKLPRKSGFEVLEWIRQQERFAELPVIVMSSSPQECDQERAFRSGANFYYVKPVSLRRLIEMVKSIYADWLATRSDESRYGQAAISGAHWVINDSFPRAFLHEQFG